MVIKFILPTTLATLLLSQGAAFAQEAAVAEAWAYVAEAIRRAPGLGHGHGPLDHGWPVRGR